MGCNCGKKRKTATSVGSYTLTMPDGATSTHTTRLDAQTTNVKQGGGGKVAPSGR